MASLMQSVSSSGLGSSVTSGPPNSPHLASRPGSSAHASGPPMPVAEHDNFFFNLPPHVARGATSSGSFGGGGGPGSSGGAAGGGVGTGAEGQAHHRHSSVSSNASSSSNLMGQPSPRLSAMDVYARPESQQDVPEADRMDTQ